MAIRASIHLLCAAAFVAAYALAKHAATWDCTLMASVLIYFIAHVVGRGIPKYYLDVVHPSPHRKLRRDSWKACLDLATLALNGIVCGPLGVVVNSVLMTARMVVEGPILRTARGASRSEPRPRPGQ